MNQLCTGPLTPSSIRARQTDPGAIGGRLMGRAQFDKDGPDGHGSRVLTPTHGQPRPPSSERLGQSPLFCTTHWSVVLAAGQSDTPQALEALESLCRAYWRPVYVYVRRHGHDSEAARDLTQEFFARLLEGNWLRPADPQRGRFRSFLLKCLSRFLVDEWRRATAQKRGGRHAFFSIEEAREQDDVSIEPVDTFTPEQAYDRNWAEAMVACANARLRRAYEADGQADRFAVLKVYLAGGEEPAAYAESAERLGLTVPAVKSAIYKLRQRYGEAVRAEIAETVSRPEDIEVELNHLLDALGG